MKKVVIFLSTLFLPFMAAAAPNYIHSPEGEVVSDRVNDLAKNPDFIWAIDPFLKLPGYMNFSEPQDFKMELQATMPDGEMPMAVMNDEVVHVGDKIGRKTIFRIGKDFVLLKEDESIVEVSIYENESAPSGAGRAPASSDSRIEQFIKPQIDIEEVIQ